jgi:hypothetical protein
VSGADRLAVDPALLREAGAASDREQPVEDVGCVTNTCACSPRWIEVRVVNDRRKPLANEACVLYLDRNPKTKLTKTTNQNGVVRFDDLSESVSDFHLQLIDVLEAWKQAPPKDEVWIPKPGDYRKKDGTAHAVKPCIAADEQTVVIDRLTEDEKFSHFHDAYVDHGAYYKASNPRNFVDSPPHWKWGIGAVCNQHVNFFLGYWYNYNAQFTTAASATYMAALPTLTSEKQAVTTPDGVIKHRGYLEFVEPVGRSNWYYEHPSVKTKWYYIRAGEPNFDRKTRAPRADLSAALGSFNVYSIADITKKASQSAAVGKAKTWFGKHPEYLPQGKAAASLTDEQVWDLVWDLPEKNAQEAALLTSMRNGLVPDHHCGVLLKRPDELKTFSADSPTKTEIVMRSFGKVDLTKRKLLYLGFWRLKPLRKGGYAPLDAEPNAGGISIDNPPRFIEWG